MPKFDAEGVLREVAARKATWLYLVPTMMSRIQRLPSAVRAQYDVSSLRRVWHVAAPCPPWLKRAWIDWLGPDVIWEVYGATESQAATVISGRQWLKKPGSVGRVVVGEMKVVGPDGISLPTGEVGDIFERPKPGEPPSFRYRGAEDIKSTDGWSTVGDIGSIDADGYVFLSDRRSDLILVGGANVYPAEVEAALEECPQVRSCAVIGLPDDDLGQSVHAVVERSDHITAEELLAHLVSRLVRYKLPRTIEFVSFPLRDDAGKVRRSQLRAERLIRRCAVNENDIER
jgi:bile acid-coenzyme A ligase